MPKIVLWGSLAPYVDGRREHHVSAATVAGAITELTDRFPGLADQISEDGVSAFVDGGLHRIPGTAPIPDDAEIVLAPRLTGG